MMRHHTSASPRCTNRLFEWICALMMTQIGLIVLLSDRYIHGKPQLAFKALTDLGLSPTTIGSIFLVIGIIRGIALRLNGDWILGPHTRVICALIGMFIWGQLCFGIIDVYFRSSEVYLSLGVWDSLLIGEYFSIKRAILDIKRPRLDYEASEVTSEDAR